MYNISYVGDGIQTEFVFAFPFFQNADVRVAIDGDTKDIDAGIYSVVPNETLTGGTVVFECAPQVGAQIDIFRQISLSRVIDYQPTMLIDPERLNDDFNFLLAAFQDLRQVDIDLAQWENLYRNMVVFLEYTNKLIQDKLTGGGVLGIYNNLVSVLANALPTLINDYGYITDAAPNENRDDYGVL